MCMCVLRCIWLCVISGGCFCFFFLLLLLFDVRLGLNFADLGFGREEGRVGVEWVAYLPPLQAPVGRQPIRRGCMMCCLCVGV